jgi:hypothetical protein
MHGQSKVFAFSFIAQPQVTFVNELALLNNSSPLLDHAIVLSNSTFVLEAASIALLSAHEATPSDFASSYRGILEKEDVFIDENLDAWFLSFDSTQKLLSTEQLQLVFSKIRHETSLSVFSGEAQPSVRLFRAAEFAKDEDLIKSDIQWYNIVTNEMYS